MDAIVEEAKERFKRCQDWEGTARARWLDDYRFANADPENGYQWPDSIRNQRDLDDRPCLTINKTRQHNLHIVNDMMQNRPSIKIVAAGGAATKKSADVFEGVVRWIEYNSDAEAAYDRATRFQVLSGIGYWRLLTEYATGDSFDQEIYIRPIVDPLGVYLDPDIRQLNGLDARFGFVFENMPREEFEKRYPRLKNNIPQNGLDGDDWIDNKHVRVAEYYRREEARDRLFFLPDVDGGTFVRESTMKGWGNVKEKLLADPRVKTRPVKSVKVTWHLIVGDRVIETRDVPGSYVPILRCVGEETVIDGILDRKGHTRALKDPQRMYNYWSSSGVEALSLQSKSPFIADTRAIEGQEEYWKTANTINHAVLPYNGVDDDGNELGAPKRADQPQMPQGYLQGMQVAASEMQMVSGQYDPMMGEPGNERSGRALNARQRQGDRATYHYINNFAAAIRATGKILVEWIPIVYDTPRILRILAEDGTETEVQLDPNAGQAAAESQKANAVQTIFNPAVGKYDVRADVGPGYATRRQEAFEAYAEITARNPDLMAKIGDLVIRYMDTPGAEDIAERLKRTIPADIRGDAPPPEVLQAQQQVEQTKSLVAQLTQLLQDKDTDLEKKDLEISRLKADRSIDSFKATTDAIAKLGVANPDQMIALITQAVVAQLSTEMPPPEPAPITVPDNSLNGAM